MERCVVHSNTFGQNDLAMAAALATLHVIEEDKLVENAAAMGEYAMRRLRRSIRRLPVCFGRPRQGPDVRHRLRPARQLDQLKIAWDMLHKLNFGVFGQMIIIPLLEKHRILTQVAGYHTEVIKFLPPMRSAKEDIDWFLAAMEEVLADRRAFPARRGTRSWDWRSGRFWHDPSVGGASGSEGSSCTASSPACRPRKFRSPACGRPGRLSILLLPRLRISSESNELFSHKVAFFKNWLDFDKEFPENQATYVVIGPEDPATLPPIPRWTGIADAIAAKLRAMPKAVSRR